MCVNDWINKAPCYPLDSIHVYYWVSYKILDVSSPFLRLTLNCRPWPFLANISSHKLLLCTLQSVHPLNATWTKSWKHLLQSYNAAHHTTIVYSLIWCIWGYSMSKILWTTGMHGTLFIGAWRGLMLWTLAFLWYLWMPLKTRELSCFSVVFYSNQESILKNTNNNYFTWITVGTFSSNKNLY